uniref:YqaJ viral recombinase domain-containing protein n=1 Tax=Sinocyclocheilus grahami TaxID=75366 RepID=A0A672QMK3_SINGR
MIPSNITKVGAEAGHRIDFTSAKAKRKSLNSLLEGEVASMPALRTSVNTCKFSIATQEQWESYLAQLQKVSPKAAILSTLPAYSDAFADPVQLFSAPDSLHSLRDKKMDGSELSILRLHCKTLASKADVTPEQAHFIERQTRMQYKCSSWCHFRTGRITASNMHSVFVSDLNNPALSTVRAVCYPSSRATNQCPATAWGRQNEENAITQYKLQTMNHHCDMEISECGFIINPKFPQVGASPDGLVQCTCCGRGCIEIKCPHKYRHCTVEDACSSCDKNFCLEVVDGELQLKNGSPY